MDGIKMKATISQNVYVDLAEALEKIKEWMGFSPYVDSFVTIRNGELVRAEDVSHHGSPDYECKNIFNNPKRLELYESVQCLEDYFKHSREPQWKRNIEPEMDESESFTNENVRSVFYKPD